MKEMLKDFDVTVEFDEESGMFIVDGSSEEISKVMEFLTNKGFHNDGAAFSALFGVNTGDRYDRLLVINWDGRKGFLPMNRKTMEQEAA